MDTRRVNKAFEQLNKRDRLPYSTLDQWVKNAKFNNIIGFVKLIEENWESSPSRNERYRDCIMRVVQGLALTEGNEYVETLFVMLKCQLFDFPFSQLAAWLASSQQIALLESYVTTTGDELQELWAHLIQELVIKGEDISRYPNLTSFWNKMRTIRHPLSSLPLNLLAVESKIHNYCPSYSIGGGRALGIPFGPSINFGTTSRSIAKTSHVNVAEITTSEFRKRISSPVSNWRLEARQFSVQKQIDEKELSETDLLLKLQLECLHLASYNDIFIKSVDATHIANILFCAAANGGAYNRGIGNAYGRLAMWQSLGALMNLPEGTSIIELEEQVSKCSWWTFEAQSDWFYRVAWDIGILVADTDRKVISILAATDTD